MKPGESVRNFYRNQGALAERERISKLLTENLEFVLWEGIFKKMDDGTSPAVDVQDIIALIKDEK